MIVEVTLASHLLFPDMEVHITLAHQLLALQILGCNK